MSPAGRRQRRLHDRKIVLSHSRERAALGLHRFGDRAFRDEVRRESGDVLRVHARREAVGKLGKRQRALIIAANLRLLRRVDRGARLLQRELREAGSADALDAPALARTLADEREQVIAEGAADARTLRLRTYGPDDPIG